MPIVLKSGSLSLLEPLGSVHACNGIVLVLQYIMIVFIESYWLLVPLCPLPYRNLSMKGNDNWRVDKMAAPVRYVNGLLFSVTTHAFMLVKSFAFRLGLTANDVLQTHTVCVFCFVTPRPFVENLH